MVHDCSVFKSTLWNFIRQFKSVFPYLCINSPPIIGEHSDKIYTYKIGICRSPDDELDDKCGILQFDKFANGTRDPKSTRCVGKISSTQVTES